MLELFGRHEDCVEQLLNLRIPCLGILQDFADKVQWMLFNFHASFWPFNDDNGVNNCVGGCHVQQQHIIGFWWYQCCQRIQILLKLDESRSRLIIPLETICFS
jgi:hypothetical protein